MPPRGTAVCISSTFATEKKSRLRLFMPPNGKPYWLISDNVVYTRRAGSAQSNYVYAFDLATRRTNDCRSGSVGIGDASALNRERLDVYDRHGTVRKP